MFPGGYDALRCVLDRCAVGNYGSDYRDIFYFYFLFNHIASSYFSYGKLPQLYYSTVLARNKVALEYPSAVVSYTYKQASVFLLTAGKKTSDREPYLAHDPLDQRGL